MNSFEKAKELIGNGQNVPKRTLFMAYLELHIKNPTIHPDDHLRDDEFCPYKGWEVILCNKVVNLLDESPIQESLHYPTEFLKLEGVIKELDSFHKDIYDDSQDDTDYQMWGNVGDVEDYFLNDVDTNHIHMAVEALQKLYLYHACENDTAEEEAEKPAGTLKTCADVLLWISQQEN